MGDRIADGNQSRQRNPAGCLELLHRYSYILGVELFFVRRVAEFGVQPIEVAEHAKPFHLRTFTDVRPFAAV